MSVTIRIQGFSTVVKNHYCRHMLLSTNKTKIHELIINEHYFQLIKSLKKTVEGRIYKNNCTKIYSGDVIKFKNLSNFQDVLFCHVKSKALYRDFKQMLEKEGLERCLPGVGNIDDDVKVYHSFPGYEEESKKYQVVAFRIVYLSNINLKRDYEH
jgi:ASC-1-like (ASCH) protein